jgi:hypothetical protein
MKKAVFYLEPATIEGTDGYIIRGWKNVLSWDKLPQEYCMKSPCFGEHKGGIEIGTKNGTYILHRDMFISLALWNEYYHIMQYAGKRLSDILRKPKIIKVEI